jgi:2,5-diamino-6-(ribosylamino)-4(3H)-pyrimidinone 5'-phosphate reductase
VPKPKVIVYQVSSVDGRLTISPETLLLYGDERWNRAAGNEISPAWRKLKEIHQPQAVLEGSGSFVLERSEPETLPPVGGDTGSLYQDFLPESVINRPGHQGWFTVVDSRGRVRWFYKEFPDKEWKGWHLLVLVSRRTPPEYLAYLQREGIPYLVAGNELVELTLAFEKLNEKLGVNSIISEAGGRLNGALLRAGLVDEVNIVFFPALIGGTDTPSLFNSPALAPGEEPVPLRFLSAQVLPCDHVWLRYEVGQ